VLFDATWGTNVYAMKLGCFTGIGTDGETNILAASILLNEDEPSFDWAFQSFLDTFKIEPAVMITDGDLAIAAAIAAVFSSSLKHVLCVYHLSLNFKTHMYPLFAGDQGAWRSVLSMFWKVAKQTDERSRPTFDFDFDEIVALVTPLDFEVDTEKAKKKAAALTWLEALRSRRQQWAYRFTWKRLTLGADSSQVNCASGAQRALPDHLPGMCTNLCSTCANCVCKCSVQRRCTPRSSAAVPAASASWISSSS
jgi:hypothetical protein